MSNRANWSYPTAIRFGAGRISEIAEAFAAAGIKKPLLATDRGLANMDITSRTLDLLEAAGLGRAMFSDVDPNPNEKNAAAGVKAYREGGHDGVGPLAVALALIWESLWRLWLVKPARCGVSKISVIGGCVQTLALSHQ